jgi:histone H3/H4
MTIKYEDTALELLKQALEDIELLFIDKVIKYIDEEKRDTVTEQDVLKAIHSSALKFEDNYRLDNDE